MIKIAILGLGNRGRGYGNLLLRHKNVEINAVCEKKEVLLQQIGNKWNIEDRYRFNNDETFFNAGKISDALLICTQDKDHYKHAKRALELGYNILLEKPISPDIKLCEQLSRLADERGLKVVVCHVLRYAPFYNAIKNVIDNGDIGDVLHINHTENVGYWHFAHSFVRGNWRSEEETSPDILAKCSHDFDIIYWFTGKKCVEMQAYGGLRYFKKENEPVGATNYCLNGCKARKNCPFDVEKIYYGFTKYTTPFMIGNKTLICGNNQATMKEFKEVLKTSPYGRCVYRCDNDVFDSQTILMKLEGNVTATLSMQALTKRCYRKIHIYGTKGEIYGNDCDAKFTLNRFGGKCEIVHAKTGGMGHLGGDNGLIDEFIKVLNGDNVSKKITYLKDSLESHKNALMSHKKMIETIKGKKDE
ncbi:MAG: Gfo/Idh/MocA family oxidoreductase [Clostridia bacterium]